MGLDSSIAHRTESLVSRACLMVGYALWMLSLLVVALPAAADYADDWGPALGSSLPMLEAPDHDGEIRDLASLAGDQGLLLFLSRSADW